MKVLQVNCVYKKGSTGKIVYDVHEQLKQRGIESVVCYGRGEKCNEQGVYKVCGEWYAKLNKLLSMFTGIMYGGCFISTNRLITVIKKEKPDVVHLHCINGNFVNIYRIVTWLKKHKIRTVLTLHAEFMHTGGCAYALECMQWCTAEGCGNPRCPRWREETGSIFLDRTHTMWKRMKKAFDGFENLTITSVSPWLCDRASKSSILGNGRHVVVLNGLDTEVFKPWDTKTLRNKHGILDEKVIFHATPKFDDDPHNIKGGCYVIQLAKEMRNLPVKFIVAGSYPAGLQVPDNMILLGRVSNQVELAQYYAMADLTVLTSSRETFSMVVAESLACGTPVVGFQAGAPEQIALTKYSSFSEYGNVELLKENVISCLEQRIDTAELRAAACQKYAKSSMLDGYIKIYEG